MNKTWIVVAAARRPPAESRPRCTRSATQRTGRRRVIGRRQAQRDQPTRHVRFFPECFPLACVFTQGSILTGCDPT